MSESSSSSGTPVGFVEEIWLYPIKAAHGFTVQKAELGDTGFKYDRSWAVVDVNGTRYPEREYISQRKLPKLATVKTQFNKDATQLLVDAPGMPTLIVPLEEEAYASNEPVTVNCSGISTTSGGGWHLGVCRGYSAGDEATEWFTTYLNRSEVATKAHAGKPPAKYMLVRSVSKSTRVLNVLCGRNQTDPLFDLQEALTEEYDRVRFQDFAPFLMVNNRSLQDLNERMGTTKYPITPFRGSIVVGGCSRPWAEEEWATFEIGEKSFRYIKECPRCTVPARNQDTGEYHFAGGSFDGVKGKLLNPQATLKNAFPKKATDASWGTWAGPFFGVYVAHSFASRGQFLCVGDKISVQSLRTNAIAASHRLSFIAMIIVAVLVAVASILYMK